MVELARRVAFVLLIFSTVTMASAAHPVDDETNPPAAAVPATAIAQSFAPIDPAPAEPPGPAKRPAALLPLYVSFTALQFADVQSTLRALDAGGREGNPVFAGLRSPAGMLAVKAGLALGT